MAKRQQARIFNSPQPSVWRRPQLNLCPYRNAYLSGYDAAFEPRGEHEASQIFSALSVQSRRCGRSLHNGQLMPPHREPIGPRGW
jgi:hypothetical protein